MDFKGAVLEFKLGDVQVFSCKADTSLFSSTKNFYWQSLSSGNIWGPFLSLFETMNHYARVSAEKKGTPIVNGNVVFVDFKLKRRVTYK